MGNVVAERADHDVPVETDSHIRAGGVRAIAASERTQRLRRIRTGPPRDQCGGHEFSHAQKLNPCALIPSSWRAAANETVR